MQTPPTGGYTVSVMLDRRPWLLRLAAPLLVLGATLAAPIPGCDTDAERHETGGGPGYPCYFHQDCEAPLLCSETLAASFPVCTGTALEGEPCGATVACLWRRNEVGLPLACVAGRCAFPNDDPDAR